MTQTSNTALQGLIAQAERLSLSSYDMGRWLYSHLVHQGFAPQFSEVELVAATRHHLLLQLDECWLDCGADNAAKASLVLLEPAQIVQQVATIDVAVLPEAQLAFMCMETAHFDHCY
ncbi:hypothetical protein L9G74_04945 [Shewanella sp. C32]|uniref:Uncharacterized protein n=1 Tax=Shewanella electrica TaxID=515560 RepID=A0ABT2FHG4_9GAMM|nr:hypothetical protein [Shewanella electrica]MCH1923873.1 hypothetical protein [Shewanella electrica]MCS4555777.1 hypothetical protein [Shewanella electrica]